MFTNNCSTACYSAFEEVLDSRQVESIVTKVVTRGMNNLGLRAKEGLPGDGDSSPAS